MPYTHSHQAITGRVHVTIFLWHAAWTGRDIASPTDSNHFHQQSQVARLSTTTTELRSASCVFQKVTEICSNTNSRRPKDEKTYESGANSGTILSVPCLPLQPFITTVYIRLVHWVVAGTVYIVRWISPTCLHADMYFELCKCELISIFMKQLLSEITAFFQFKSTYDCYKDKRT
jgi:hypothetical protein